MGNLTEEIKIPLTESNRLKNVFANVDKLYFLILLGRKGGTLAPPAGVNLSRRVPCPRSIESDVVAAC